mgnify:CR=1 FL=1
MMTMVVPSEVIIVPLYLIVRDLTGLIHSGADPAAPDGVWGFYHAAGNHRGSKRAD